MKTNYHIIDNFSEKETIFRKIFANIIFFIGVTKIPFKKNKLTLSDYYKALKVIKKGDLVLVGHSMRVSGYFVKGQFKHALLYIKNKKLIHTIADGVEIIDMYNVFKKYDSMIILRPNLEDNVREKTISNTITYARKQIGKPYNFHFKSEEEKFICTDLIYSAYKNGGFKINFKNNQKAKNYFRKMLSYRQDILYPDKFLDLENKFQEVFLSKNLIKKEGKIYNTEQRNIKLYLLNLIKTN